jgi:hypothetical protein
VASRHSQLVRATLDLLTLWRHEVFPVKNLATPHIKGGEITWSRGQLKPGVADVCGCHAHGRFIACEIKITPDTLRPEQIRFKAEVEQRGGLFVEVRDTTQALLDAHAEGQL